MFSFLFALWSCRCSCMGSTSVSSCRCVMCASRGSYQFCMTCSLSLVCMGVVVVRLSVHVHFSLGLSPRDS